MAAPPIPNWQAQILKGVNAPVTPANLEFLNAWARAEGGGATNNPFNTTQPAGGATAYNSVGVRNYATPQQGIGATVQTLLNGRYGNIISALQAGKDARAAAAALAASPWGTGALVQKILGGKSSPASSTAPPMPGAPAPSLPQANTGISPIAVAVLQRNAEMFGLPVPPIEALTQRVRAALPTSPAPGMPPLAQMPAQAGHPGKVTLSANADRSGVEIHPEVVNFVQSIAGLYGRPLTIGTGTNHNQYVVGTHRQSDHWTGWAADVPASGAALTKLGQDALIAAGADPKWARKQTGGVFNIGGKQILFNTKVGGNHYNHLHVGLSGH